MTTAKVEAPVDDTVIGARVHTLMWDQRITQRRMAASLGLTPAGINRKMRGERPWFATELTVVANTLGVSLDALCAPTETPAELPHLDSNQKPFD